MDLYHPTGRPSCLFSGDKTKRGTVEKWNVPWPPVDLQELKKEVQGVGHFLGAGLGSAMGRPFMCR